MQPYTDRQEKLCPFQIKHCNESLQCTLKISLNLPCDHITWPDAKAVLPFCRKQDAKQINLSEITTEKSIKSHWCNFSHETSPFPDIWSLLTRHHSGPFFANFPERRRSRKYVNRFIDFTLAASTFGSVLISDAQFISPLNQSDRTGWILAHSSIITVKISRSL